MSQPSTAEVTITEGEDETTRVYVVSPTGVPITLGKATGWGLTVTAHYPDRVSETIHTLSNIEPAGFFQPEVTYDGGWTANSVGYTFAHRLLNSNVQFKGLHRYTLEYNFRTVDYGQLYATKRIFVRPSQR